MLIWRPRSGSNPNAQLIPVDWIITAAEMLRQAQHNAQHSSFRSKPYLRHKYIVGAEQ